MDTLSKANEKLSTSEKLGYTFTDMAGNLLYVTITTYILYFYTDVFQISVAASGTILLIARIVDAISAPIWGSIVDHTHTRWGQSRPYFLWLAIPFALSVFLAFTAPNLHGNAKMIYAAVTYILAAGVIYTGVQTPITAILPSLTTNPKERISANTWRMCGGQIGAFITSSFALSFIAFFGKGNDKVGFMWTTALFGIVAVGMFLYAFTHLKEKTVAVTKPIPFKDSVKAAVGNKPWFILVISFAIYWIAQSDRNGIAVYYAKYNLGNEQLASILNGVGVLGLLATVCIPFIVKNTNKTLTMMIGLAIGTIGQVMVAIVGDNLALIITAWIIGTFGASIACAMPFAMLADTVDFGEWKTGIRASGFLTAVGSAFCIQLGSGFGSFIPSKIMAAAGFVANKTQDTTALSSINFCFIWLPVIIYVVVAILMSFYLKYEKNEPNILAELDKRHAEMMS
ncbi:MFS transporter [Weissella bombi]|uniref:Sugar (Glycoside-Pentoside-Hexuronide) transporter n=1 Tax=Weissella bombi TaxID=1505725 RepID=A0A1C4BKC6_9LACO|nr:MFS transporter [Weissella bombi]SCC07359.1 sugar (Glycoside-Pentoside-Hexuronide) transporter [Weissella bombi]